MGEADERQEVRAGTLRERRVAELRARVRRWAIWRCLFGVVFAVGAVAHVLGPVPVDRTSVLWASILVVLSAFHVAIGVRAIARLRQWPANVWQVVTFGWGAGTTVLVMYLLRRGG